MAAKPITEESLEEAFEAAKLAVQHEFDILNLPSIGIFAAEPLNPSVANIHLVRVPLVHIGQIGLELMDMEEGSTPSQAIGIYRDMQLAKIEACNRGIMISDDGLPSQLLRLRAQITIKGIEAYAQFLGIEIAPPDKEVIEKSIVERQARFDKYNAPAYVFRSGGLPVINEKVFSDAVDQALQVELTRVERAAQEGYALGGDQQARLKMQVELWKQNYRKEYDTCGYIEHKENELSPRSSHMLNRAFLSILRCVRENLDFPPPDAHRAL